MMFYDYLILVTANVHQEHFLEIWHSSKNLKTKAVAGKPKQNLRQIQIEQQFGIARI